MYLTVLSWVAYTLLGWQLVNKKAALKTVMVVKINVLFMLLGLMIKNDEHIYSS